MSVVALFNHYNSFFCTGSLAATRLIIEIAGVECVDDHDSQDRTALHLATIGGHGDVVNFLLEKGGISNLCNLP